jgi:hypothetical protein
MPRSGKITVDTSWGKYAEEEVMDKWRYLMRCAASIAW